MKPHPSGAEPVVVFSVLEDDRQSTARALESAPAGSGLLEIRADRLHPDDVEALVACIPRPVIVTARRTGDGGSFSGSEDERRRMLSRALGAGAAYIDVEHGSELTDLAAGPGARRVILSFHGGRARRQDLLDLHREMARSPAARRKIVPRAESLSETAAVRDLLSETAGGPPLACFATGPAGRVTRILAPAWGSWATYGSAASDRATGEGQLPAQDLIDVWDVLRTTPEPLRFALVGGSVGASPSAAMHAAGYRAAGVHAQYLPLDAHSIDEVLALTAPGGALSLAGLAVTIPFKEDAAKRCELSDECARRSGAVNTMRREGDRFFGFNTDGPAILELVSAQCEPSGAKVAIAGAGGTARAAAAMLGAAGASLHFFARKPAEAARMAREFGGNSGSLNDLASADWEVLIQATPLGAQGETLLPPAALAGRRFVLDAVYGAAPTPLVQAAREAGVAFSDGFDLLVAQAGPQFRILTGHSIAGEILAAAGQNWIARSLAARSPRRKPL